jgi:hypothetical protein
MAILKQMIRSQREAMGLDCARSRGALQRDGRAGAIDGDSPLCQSLTNAPMEGYDMRQKPLILAVLTALATTGLMVPSTQAQTGGMDRRDDRRDTREDGREAKAECKAGDEESRPECRQEKRDTKQEGRGNDQDETDKPEAEKPQES